MRFAPSLATIAIGAIIRYAFHLHGGTVNLATVGLIIMLAGILMLAIRLLAKPRVAEHVPLSQADLVEVDQRVAPAAASETVVVDGYPGGTRPAPVPASTTVIHHNYAGDEAEPRLYNLAGQPVRHE